MPIPAADITTARRLVLEHGTSSSAYQILNPGISHWFSQQRDAVVGYVEYAGFRIVAASPVCPDSRLLEVVGEFESDARRSGLRLCYFGTEAPVALQLEASGGHARIRLGAQPVWNPSRWDQAVAGHASLRAQLHRARNKGVTVREWPVGEHVADAKLQRCLEEWLATRGAPPMHFLVEPQTLGRLFDRRLFVAERGADVVGFLVASPVPRRNGWLIEQVIRGAGAVNGTSEGLIDAAVRALARDGAEFVSLGLSPLSTRGCVGQVPTSLWLRLLLGWLRAHGRRFYNFEGLDAFKAKLRPESWEPLYAVTDRSRFSPDALYAIAGAFTQGSPVAATLRALGWAASQEMRALRRRPPARIAVPPPTLSDPENRGQTPFPGEREEKGV
ncbi:MAG: phosphatidylglycerol lysyltransferase domain-containing protein [Candidatus Binatia bacterium]